MLDTLQSNQFLSGGLLLVILGALFAYFRNLPRKIYLFFERFFITRLEIMDEDESYQWMKAWLADRLNNTLSMSVTTRTNKKEQNATMAHVETLSKPTDNRPVILFVPAPGTYFMWFERRLCLVTRTRSEQSQATSANSNLKMHESFNIRIFSRNRDVAKRMVEQARDYAIPQDGKIDIRIATHSYWTLADRTKPRSLDSVILDNNMGDKLYTEILSFKHSQDWYDKLGIPYRLGILLYGSPGNGKSSIVKALASALNMNIYILNLSAKGLSDSWLNQLLLMVADNSIILMEDVDCAFSKRNNRNKSENAGELLTFSGLLNALDGIAAQSGRIVIMTTNHKDKLDPALIRPGRADIHLLIDNASRDQARRLFLRFYGEKYRDLADQFAGIVPSKQLSMAFLQGHLMSHKNWPQTAVNTLDSAILKRAEEDVELKEAV